MSKLENAPIFIRSSQILYPVLMVTYVLPISTTRVTGIVDSDHWMNFFFWYDLSFGTKLQVME